MPRPLPHPRRAAVGIGLFLAAVAASVAPARAAFPEHPITIVVPFDPGGSLDLHARAVAQVMQRLVGQTLVVVNRRGAVGSIGLQSVANAKPDGYTIVATPLPIVTNPEVDGLFDRPPAFSTDAFAPLCLLSNDPLVLVVRDESPWRSLDALITAARDAPGALKYPSPGPYGSVHLATELFADQAGVKLLHVPFTGTAPSLNALLTGEVDLFFAPTTTAIAQVEGGRLRALAVTGEARFANLPAVPTLGELGYPNLVTNWYALFAHRDTPA
ncbi:MAG: tripartite tricarboxylate transporter substrate binding protein, partial [Alphaproteobacteria bacterium]|nr:tripartite tricarboxylate transporter substrate binding protein [Alphaproteobacteria bacterium]